MKTRTVSMLLSGAAVAVALGEKPLVVHEWGTFTVLQDAKGNAVPGVNINEETLPAFVHNLAPDLAPDSDELAPLLRLSERQLARSKGIQRFYHPATMRMETPIIYLYPPEGEEPKPVDVAVDFHGGWITEWYPAADVLAPGYKKWQQRITAGLNPKTVGEITWENLRITPGAEVPPTNSPVWLAPRQTAAPQVTAAGGESESYLFYRGVANLEAPLRVVRDGARLEIEPNEASTCRIEDYSDMKLWLVEIDADDRLVYRPIGTGVEDGGDFGATVRAGFDAEHPDGRDALRGEMLEALEASGLFRDEAEAMLNTWEVSYFRTPGTRVFFTLPQEWTDRVLPLDVAGYDNVETARAMIGRIELVSDAQRALVEKIASGPVSGPGWFNAAILKGGRTEGAKRQDAIVAGKLGLKDLGVEVPEDYAAYMELGRFRDAIVLHAIETKVVEAENGVENLRAFVKNYRVP